MIYSVSYSIPANTGESEAVVQTVKLSPGVLSQIEINFPSGCAGLVHVQLLHWSVKQFPSDPSQSFIGNDINLIYNEPFLMEKAPFEIQAKIWNLDDTYPHAPMLRFQVLDKSNNLIDVIKSVFLIR